MEHMAARDSQQVERMAAKVLKQEEELDRTPSRGLIFKTMELLIVFNICCFCSSSGHTSLYRDV